MRGGACRDRRDARLRAAKKFEHVVAFSRSTSPSIDLLDEVDAPDNNGSFTAEIQRAVARHRPGRIVVLLLGLSDPTERAARRGSADGDALSDACGMSPVPHACWPSYLEICKYEQRSTADLDQNAPLRE